MLSGQNMLEICVTLIAIIFIIETCVTYRNFRGDYWYLQLDFMGFSYLPVLTVQRQLAGTASVSLTVSFLNINVQFLTYRVLSKVNNLWFWIQPSNETCLTSFGLGYKRAFCFDITNRPYWR